MNLTYAKNGDYYLPNLILPEEPRVTAGVGNAADAALPESIVTSIESTGFLDSIPLWAVTLIGGLLTTILSFIMILTVYGRFFKLYCASGRTVA